MFANWFFCVLHILIFFSTSLYAPPKKQVPVPQQKSVVASRRVQQPQQDSDPFEKIQENIFNCIQQSNTSGLESILEKLTKIFAQQKDFVKNFGSCLGNF